MYYFTYIFLIFLFADEHLAVSKKKNGVGKTILQPDTDEVIKISVDDWNLPFFPDKMSHSSHSIFSNRDSMFNVDPACDDGKTNLTTDDGSFDVSTICFRATLLPDTSMQPIIHEDHIPPLYRASHICMDTPIEYSDPLITFGSHRPIWGSYGEYEFIPKQRWLHNLEHGAIVMLYHPCAHPLLVDQLRNIVTSCLKRHIITPYNLLTHERPLAIFTWGKFLSMSAVDSHVVMNFIKQNAFKAPENIEVDGGYNYLLTKPAKIVSDEADSTVCPEFTRD